MLLKSLKYSQFIGKTEAWELEKFDFNEINLIVGKNASGKTKTLNIISGMASLISGERRDISCGNFEVTFSKDAKNVIYELNIEDHKVTREKLIVDRDILLDRKIGGKGTIFFKKFNQTEAFQTPENEIAAFTRRDSVQHPFLEDLFDWAKSVRHYHFGTDLGRNSILLKTSGERIVNYKDSNLVGLFLKKGIEKYGKSFKNSIKNEMKLLGYHISDLGVERLPNVSIPSDPLIKPEGIYIYESDVKAKTYQMEISQGMFRALSLIVQLNFSYLENKPSCILIDDIGEGLDYDRSNSLIKLLINKVKKSPVQLIMSTNDRFVMNNVPLEYWAVIKREKGKSKIYNYKNSKGKFDDFRFTGLNNFDFFSTDFYLKGFKK